MQRENQRLHLIYKPPPAEDYSKNYCRLIIVIVISFVFIAGQLAGGFISGSISVISDAFHLITDLIGFIISFLFIHLSRMPPNNIFSFGYHRMELLGALGNLFVIYVLACFLVYQATLRIINKEFVAQPLIMLIVAGGGLVINIVMYFVLHGGSSHSHGLMAQGCQHNHNPEVRQQINLRESCSSDAQYCPDICEDQICLKTVNYSHCHKGQQKNIHKHHQHTENCFLSQSGNKIVQIKGNLDRDGEEIVNSIRMNVRHNPSQSNHEHHNAHEHHNCYNNHEHHNCYNNHEHHNCYNNHEHHNCYNAHEHQNGYEQDKNQRHEHENGNNHKHNHEDNHENEQKGDNKYNNNNGERPRKDKLPPLKMPYKRESEHSHLNGTDNSKHSIAHPHQHKPGKKCSHNSQSESRDQHQQHAGHNHDEHDHSHESHHQHQQYESIGMQAAILHALSDVIQSIGLLIGALIIFFLGSDHGAKVSEWNNWHYIDPIFTYVFSVIVVISTIPIVKNCYRLMMETTPDRFDLGELKRDIEAIEGVIDVHDLHIWDLRPGKTLLIAHVIAGKGTQRLVLTRLTDLSRHKKIYHSTFQVQQQDYTDDEDYIVCHHDIH